MKWEEMKCSIFKEKVTKYSNYFLQYIIVMCQMDSGLLFKKFVTWIQLV